MSQTSNLIARIELTSVKSLKYVLSHLISESDQIKTLRLYGTPDAARTFELAERSGGEVFRVPRSEIEL